MVGPTERSPRRFTHSATSAPGARQKSAIATTAWSLEATLHQADAFLLLLAASAAAHRRYERRSH
jgi:hypothetical protein